MCMSNEEAAKALISEAEYLSAYGWETVAQAMRMGAEALRVMQWQPIETAPKDGKYILMLDHNDQQRVAKWWNNGKGPAWFWACAEVSTPCPVNWPKGCMQLPPCPATPRRKQ